MPLTLFRSASSHLAGFACALSLAALGCGQADPEAELAAATEALADARADVEAARDHVGDQEAAIAEAREELERRREALRAAQARLSEVEARVDLTATDEALFRTIQKRLLQDASLERVAIAASVDKGAVSLTGEVPSAELRDRAVEIARGVPGVGSVDSRIRVTPPVAAQ